MIQAAYIHLPFCTHKCDFCDFAAFSGMDHLENEYCQILLEEIKQRLKQTQSPIKLNSVFYGGGTPSLVAVENLARIHNGLCSLVDCDENLEVTLESTPHSITEEKCKSWRNLGINRISIGVESLIDSELVAIGRDHNSAQARKGIEVACEAGFPAISLDFMYSLPTQTLESWQDTLNEFVRLSQKWEQIKHVSAYGLELSGNSPLYSRFPKDSPNYPCDETYSSMRMNLIDTLKIAGFEQYEVSNFSRPGFACRHNLTYWKNAEYLAFGVGAHRYVDGVRSSNFRSLAKYMREPISDELAEVITPDTRLKEGIMLGLRMIHGINLADFERNYRVNLMDYHQKSISRMLEGGMLELKNGNLAIAQGALGVSNSIIAEFM